MAQPDTVRTFYYDCGEDGSKCKQMIRTSDGGFFFGGTAPSRDDPGYDFFVVKADSNAEHQWSRKYAWGMSDHLESVAETSDGGYLLCGDVRTNVGMEPTIVRIDSSGDIISVNHYNASTFERIISDKNGGAVAIGGGHTNAYAVCVDSEGEVIWEGDYGNGTGIAHDVVQTHDDGYLLALEVIYGGVGVIPGLVRLTPDGDEIWHREYGDSNGGYFAAAVELQTSEIVAVGSYGGFTKHLYIVKVDSSGDEIWSRVIETSRYDHARDLILLPDGGFFVVGERDMDRQRRNAYLAYRLNSEGEVLWHLDIGDFQLGVFESVVLMEDMSYAIGGIVYRQRNDRGEEYWLIRTGPDPANNSVVLLDPAFPSQFVFNAPYPNPFNSSVRISFSSSSLSSSSPRHLRPLRTRGRRFSPLACRGGIKGGVSFRHLERLRLSGGGVHHPSRVRD